MTSLLTRIESGQGADEALDLDIIKTLLPEAVVMRADTDEEGKVIPGKSHEYTHWRLTSSLDAVLSLVERMLPGWRVVNLCEWDDETLRARGPWMCDLKPPGTQGDVTVWPAKCPHAQTAPRALLIALLRALESSP